MYMYYCAQLFRFVRESIHATGDCGGGRQCIYIYIERLRITSKSESHEAMSVSAERRYKQEFMEPFRSTYRCTVWNSIYI